MLDPNSDELNLEVNLKNCELMLFLGEEKGRVGVIYQKGDEIRIQDLKNLKDYLQKNQWVERL